MENRRFYVPISLQKIALLVALAGVIFIGKIYGGGLPNSYNLQEKASNQQKTITGKVIDSQGMPLPGVSVMVKGNSNKGVATDFDGNYTIEVASSDILIFSYIGFSTQEIPVKGKSKIDVTLKEAAQELDQVVVTALGIKRAEKTLSYAQQKVDSEEITKTKDLNFVNSLSGKTSGIQLSKSASGAGGSSKIVLRGNKSIVGVSSPLFVIDGIPMLSTGVGTSDKGDFYGQRDKSDALSQINPDDIESITVLKGSNAAILYGSQGANGVIMITTKKGKEGKLSGSISSSLSFESIMELPKLQYRYGSVKAGEVSSWSYTKGNYNDTFVKDFFETGYNTINSISLSGGSANNATYLSYSNTLSKGIMPKNQYNKHNLTIKQDGKYLDDKLTVSAKVMLTDEEINNRPQIGYYFNPLTGLYWFPRNLDFSFYKNYQTLDKVRNVMTQTWHINQDRQQNPYWIINNNSSVNRLKRLITSVSAGYNFTDELKLQVRGNYDYTNSTFDQQVRAGTISVLSGTNGRWIYSKTEDIQLYTDAILTYSKSFENFSINTLVGSSYENSTIGDGIDLDTTEKHNPKFANIFNFQNLNPNTEVKSVLTSRVLKQSVFGNLEIGIKNSLFFDISARNDWASTLAFTKNYSYFYPSFGVSAIISEMIDLPQAISFMKVRSSYSIVANEIPSFITNPLNNIGGNGLEANTKKPFTELEPEKQKSFEVGLDIRMFNNRLGLDVTYYNINTENQFLDLNAPSGSGYTKYFVNAGNIRNRGLEATLNITPVKTEDFTWNSTFNYSMNRNKIISLHKDLKGKYVHSGTGGYALYITEGGSFGDIYVTRFVRDDQGRIKLTVKDKNDPSKRQVVIDKSSEREYIGNSQPKFLLGWNNTFSYKNFNFSFLIDGKFGGKAVSITDAILDAYGVSEASAIARDNGSVTINGITDEGKEVTSFDPKSFYQTVGSDGGILEHYTYDATNIRLRQLALSYTFDLKDKGKFFKSLNTSLIANNLFFLYKKAPFDPDISMSTGNKLQAINLYALPPTRTYGLSVKLNF